MVKKQQTEKKSTASKYLVGAGVAAALVGGVVGFLTQTKQGKSLAKKGQQHALEASKKITERAEKVKDMSKARYEALVDEVLSEYTRTKKIAKGAADDLSAQLKKEWLKVRTELKKK